MKLEALTYHDGASRLKGWLARPAGAPRGAVLVFPTIANLTPNVERKALALADAGYLALVADFYGEPIPDFEASRPLAEKLRADVDIYRARLAAALMALAEHPESQGLVLAVIGFCMGGQAALELARAGADVRAAVSFHGILTTARRASAGAIRARLLICHGEADPFAPRDDVLALWDELNHAGADWHFHAYGKVRHGFSDPGSDERGVEALAYDACADRQSWEAMLALFDEILTT